MVGGAWDSGDESGGLQWEQRIAAQYPEAARGGLLQATSGSGTEYGFHDEPEEVDWDVKPDEGPRATDAVGPKTIAYQFVVTVKKPLGLFMGDGPRGATVSEVRETFNEAWITQARRLIILIRTGSAG
jgi:hypothetical protein